jgi:hypothetical protein
MPDWLKLAFWIGSITGVIAWMCFAYVLFWGNGGSRNLALAFGALTGAIILLGMQLWFELRTDPTHDFLTAEYTIDQNVGWIGRPDCNQRSSSWRPVFESGVEEALSKARLPVFDNDRTKLVHDMVVYSLLGYLLLEHRDWQLKRLTFKGRTGHLSRATSRSTPQDSTIFTANEMLTRLREAGNSFADLKDPYLAWQVWLPPLSELRVTASDVIIRNQFVEIKFIIVPSGSASTKDGGKYDIRTGIQVEVNYSQIRAQNKEMPKYQKWTMRVVNEVREWFDPSDVDPAKC